MTLLGTSTLVPSGFIKENIKVCDKIISLELEKDQTMKDLTCFVQEDERSLRWLLNKLASQIWAAVWVMD